MKMSSEMHWYYNFITGTYSAVNNAEDIYKGAAPVRCNSTRTNQKIEGLLAVVFPVGTAQQVPETAAQLREYCNLYGKNFPFVLGYFKNCVGQFSKTVAKVILYSLKKQTDSTCKPGKISRQARELMAAGGCANKARDGIQGCNKKLIDSLLGVKSAELKDRIYMTCWYILVHSNAYRICLRDTTEDTPGCTAHTVDWAEKFVLKVMGSSISLVCGEYFEESDKCRKLVDKTPKPDLPKNYVKPKNFILPMLELMETFPDI
ncbi:unnamed protein product [Oppiella nova]|uniref:Uncharacterized protein n=1 Tax=Oppiella nova TaxID=334625 RepID=A0A7R9M813_9ACAR|nr:unnamed protein product [Oppiella nova]CAG2171174.1 unnamed protein product [Oppiella nova]